MPAIDFVVHGLICFQHIRVRLGLCLGPKLIESGANWICTAYVGWKHLHTCMWQVCVRGYINSISIRAPFNSHRVCYLRLLWLTISVLYFVACFAVFFFSRPQQTMTTLCQLCLPQFCATFRVLHFVSFGLRNVFATWTFIGSAPTLV